MEETYAWLNANVPAPSFASGDWPEDGFAWFRQNDGEALQRIWEIGSILKESGIPVRIIRSKNPGAILYADDYQVVVKEWKLL